MTTTTDTTAVLTRLERQRADLVAAAAALASAGEKRRLTTAEEATWEGYLGDLERLDARVAAVARPAALDGVRSEPLTYQRGGEHSFFADLAFRGQRPGSEERLARHQREMDVELRRRREADERRLDRARADGLVTGVERRANPSTATGAGGGFAPPAWLLDAFSSIGRAGRPLGDLATQIPLPAGISSINAPRMLTGTAVATQVDLGAVTQVDVTDAAVTGKVATLAGKLDISVQLRDQAGISGVDEYISRDLAVDYNRALEVELINGTGTGGRPLGVLNVSSIVSVSSATATVPGVLVAAGQAASQVATGRGLPPTTMLVHGRRWYWLASQADTATRPFVNLGEGADMDDPGGMAGGVGRVGPVLGLPVYQDMAIPTGAGAGTEDRIVVCRPEDMLLFESAPIFQAMPDVLSGTLQVRLLLRRHVVFLPHRWPSSIGIVTGASLAAPSGY